MIDYVCFVFVLREENFVLFNKSCFRIYVYFIVYIQKL